MIKINSQYDFDTFLNLPYWEDAFLREWYLLSPSYILPKDLVTVASDSAPSMFILICTTDPAYPCIELFFENVEEIHLSCRGDLNPTARFQNNGVSFSFRGEETSDIVAQFIYYRILDEDYLGWKVRYGKIFFDPSGFLDMPLMAQHTPNIPHAHLEN